MLQHALWQQSAFPNGGVCDHLTPLPLSHQQNWKLHWNVLCCKLRRQKVRSCQTVTNKHDGDIHHAGLFETPQKGLSAFVEYLFFVFVCSGELGSARNASSVGHIHEMSVRQMFCTGTNNTVFLCVKESTLGEALSLWHANKGFHVAILLD